MFPLDNCCNYRDLSEGTSKTRHRNRCYKTFHVASCAYLMIHKSLCDILLLNLWAKPSRGSGCTVEAWNPSVLSPSDLWRSSILVALEVASHLQGWVFNYHLLHECMEFPGSPCISKLSEVCECVCDSALWWVVHVVHHLVPRVMS